MNFGTGRRSGYTVLEWDQTQCNSVLEGDQDTVLEWDQTQCNSVLEGDQDTVLERDRDTVLDTASYYTVNCWE
jgi:hypothetical protein